MLDVAVLSRRDAVPGEGCKRRFGSLPNIKSTLNAYKGAVFYLSQWGTRGRHLGHFLHLASKYAFFSSTRAPPPWDSYTHFFRDMVPKMRIMSKASLIGLRVPALPQLPGPREADGTCRNHSGRGPLKPITILVRRASKSPANL